MTCSAFMPQDCSGTALNPIIDGTSQRDTMWGTVVGQRAGLVEHIGSVRCRVRYCRGG